MRFAIAGVVVAVGLFPSVARAQESPPPNDSFATAHQLTVPGTTGGTTRLASSEAGEPNVCNADSGSVWFRFTATATRSLALDVVATDGRASEFRLGLFKGTSLPNLEMHDCFDPNVFYPNRNRFPGQLNFWAYPGTTYYLQVSEATGGDGGPIEVSIDEFTEPEPIEDWPDPCTDDRFELSGWRIKGESVWLLNPANLPPGFTKGEVAGAIKRALKTLKTSGNSCGLADQLSIRTRYGGTTQKSASTCSNRVDRFHVIVFLSSMPTASGLNCTNSRDRVATDSDIQISRQGWTLDPLTHNCWENNVTRHWDLEGVLLHEFAHGFGMGHTPGPSSHLVMNENQAGCSSYQRTFGLGDVLGLRRLY